MATNYYQDPFGVPSYSAQGMPSLLSLSNLESLGRGQVGGLFDLPYFFEGMLMGDVDPRMPQRKRVVPSSEQVLATTPRMTQPTPQAGLLETAGAFMSPAPVAAVKPVAQAVGKAVKATEGLPVGMGIKSVGDDIFNLSKQEFLGKPRITKNANAADLKPIELTTLKDIEPQPFMGGKYQIKMNEDGAVVLDKGKPIASYNFGDTLVVDKPYRKSGLAQELVYEWRTSFPAPAVAKERTKASQSIQEKVWERIQNEKRSLPKQSPYPQQTALDLAQQRAALPVSEGGLGLPANNTPMDRARAMGFDVNTPLYHATDVDFTSINPSVKGKYGAGVYTATTPKYAEIYAQGEKARTLPLMARGKLASDDERIAIADQMLEQYQAKEGMDVPLWKKMTKEELANRGYTGVSIGKERLIFNPSDLRSRFAAFDPFRKDVATATAMGVALPDLLAAEPTPQPQSSGLLYPFP